MGMVERDLALKIAWAHLSTPYLWGGDDPIAGMDCSGFVIEVLKSVGSLPMTGDWTAAGLWEFFKDKPADKPYEGCLVFFTDRAGAVIHIEMMVTAEHSIGASGGGSATKTAKDAVDQNAYVKVRPIQARARNIKGFLDPFKI